MLFSFVMGYFAVFGLLNDTSVSLGGALFFLLYVAAQRAKLRRYNAAITNVETPDETRLTLSFFHAFLRVARLALPTVRCREFAGTVVFILLFLVKSFLRVVQSSATGHLLRSIAGGAEGRAHDVPRLLLRRVAVSMVTAVCSGSVEHLRSWLVACYRERLSRYFQRRFYSHLLYYQATVLDNRLEAADAVISTHCAEFAEHFAELPYYFLLPVFECLSSIVALTRQVGAKGTGMSCGAIAVLVFVLQRLSPPFGRIHASVLAQEDAYRRILTNNLNSVECIAMHRGGDYMRMKLDKQLGEIKHALDHFALAKGHFSLLEFFTSSFLLSISSFIIFCSSLRQRTMNASNIYVETQYVLDLIDSVKCFIVNFREISHLSTFTMKLSEFDTILGSIAQGNFFHSANRAAVCHETTLSPVNHTHVNFTNNYLHETGQFELFSFSNLTLMTPVGQLLLSDLNLKFERNQNWVILGENGCGKTSFLRMISGLWPPTSGHCAMNRKIKLFFAPQQSYMVPQCTLIEQVLFPNNVASVGKRELDLFQEAIRLAGAQSVVDVLGGLDSPFVGADPVVADETYAWDSLSGGQKQRISMARVFYHVLTTDREQEIPVAVLDEATSMMDDTEQGVLLNLRKLNVCMISVTHRDEVVAHHTHVLRILPGGRWSTDIVSARVGLDAAVQGA